MFYETHFKKHWSVPLVKEQEFHAISGNFSVAQITPIELALKTHLVIILFTQSEKPRVPQVKIIFKTHV